MRFVIDLWPDETETEPGELVRYAISRIRDSGEDLAWEIRSDLTDEKLFDVGPEAIHEAATRVPRPPTSLIYLVGDTGDTHDVKIGEQSPVLGAFATEELAAGFIETLPDYLSGRYFLDGPADD